MAPPSPRRSSRARGNTVSQSQQSSTTSSLSSRGERNTRSLNKTSSAKSTPSASLSSEPPEDLEDPLPSRRRTRAQEDARDKARVDPYDMATGSDDIQEDDESVRCVCGFDEYPGPPPFEEDPKHGKQNPEADFFASIELSEEVSGLFVQCDVCKVWQHGACVGIFTEESSPDEYFCEKCRKDLHKIHTATNGLSCRQRYSNYLPLNRPSRATSRAGSLVKDGTRSPKETSKNGRASSATQSSKRRSTMNSRDAAYDEDEQLRRAIEASKEDQAPEQTEITARRGKRGRSDSEENLASLKRQRTSSPSMSPPPEKSQAVEDESEEESNTRNGQSKKVRSARNQREKSEREERDRQRAEAANRRKGRADRRRAEGTTTTNLVKESEAHVGTDSDPSEEVPVVSARPAVKPSTEVAVPLEAPPSSAPTPDTPPANPVLTGSTHKKSSRNHQKRGKGRNQYTKDRDEHEDTPARSMSRDIVRNHDDHIGAGVSKHSAADHSKHGARNRANNAHSKVSMNDMKRRVTAFLDFISKTQVELAGEALPGSRSSQNSSQQQSPRATIAPDAPKISVDGAPDMEAKESSVGNGALNENVSESKEFKALNCVEMMDVLTRDLLRWQNQYAS
ncbi:histone deacetylase complex subunit cti6 [Colletotrichum truncatum]|uniref:Histone deacetylase complex subunit cti6 n=1 Tax=Colletotrichum truncatum TaxID=5467 RepID=A0ACC3Z0H8_COLTU|nr:histone deacetylase complex subunit cti6 [Colletotrichum truncatum]KAF6800631.1 histone deacetylase complex subunit cti6 [Colletotrichum truncatum]